MSNIISNKFIVTALSDGYTVTGELVSTRSLWQAISDGGNPLPDWESDTESDRPLLYPLLQSGGNVISPLTDVWKYNNETIVFNSTTGLSTNAGFAGYFKRITTNVPGTSPSVAVPALRIMKNLAATSTNEDNDTISLSGTVSINDATLPFDAMQTVTITKAGASSTVGELKLTDGKNTLNGDSDTVEIQAVLHSSAMNTANTNFHVEWWWNGSKQRETTGTGTVLSQNHKIQVSGAEVTDYIVVEARFLNLEGTQVAVAYVGIDDIGDVDQMQFAYTIYDMSGTAPTSIVLNNTTAATLKSGQAVLYGVWIGTKDDPLTQRTPSQWTYSATIYDASANNITNTSDSSKQIAQPVRQASFVVGTTTLSYVATMTLTFPKVVANGGTVSVIIQATSSQS